MLALDRSGSMLAQDVDPGPHHRLARGRADASSRTCPPASRVGVVSFSDSADALSAPSLDRRPARRSAIARIQAGGGTAIGDAIERSLGLLGVTQRHEADRGAGKGRAILLLSDGSNTQGIDPSTAAAIGQARGRARLHDRARHAAMACSTCRHSAQGTGTIPVPPDPEALQGDRARDRRRVVHRARRVRRSRRSTTASARASARPRSRRKSRSSSPASQRFCCSRRRAPPGHSGAPHDVRRSVPAGRARRRARWPSSRTWCSRAAAAGRCAPPRTRRCGRT